MAAVQEKAGVEAVGDLGSGASVVGQDKGNALLYRATTDFRRFFRSFSARQNDAYASEDRVRHTSQYRAVLKPLSGRARRCLLTLASAIGAVAAMVVVGRLLHLRVMLTDSSARAGVYRLIAAPAGRGALVAACLPVAIGRSGRARGYLRQGDCPAGAEPVAKVIGALPGDLVELCRDRVAINGVSFANSRTAAHDSDGRALHHESWGARRVAPGQAWLFGFNDARSWDARYFGPVPRANVRGVLKPVVTW